MPNPLLDGPRNFRDPGGLPTADGRETSPGKLFRSDGLSHMSGEGLSKLISLEITAMVGLRTASERKRVPDRLPGNNAIAVCRYGFLANDSNGLFRAVDHGGADQRSADEMMMSNSRRMPLEHAEQIRLTLLAATAPDSVPCLIHCTSGKDRTGLVCALVLLALGVPKEHVVCDFELSDVEHQPADVFGEQALPDAVSSIMSAHRDLFHAAIDAVENKFGGIDDYFKQMLGLRAEWQEVLRHRLLSHPRRLNQASAASP